MAFDSPSLGGYRFKNPPKPMDMQWKAMQQLNTLADGGLKQRILGYRLDTTLRWDEGWIRQEDLTGIRAVANDTTAILTFVPYPDSHPFRSFDVIWRNKFDFAFRQDGFEAYKGTIELQTLEITASAGGPFIYTQLRDTNDQRITDNDDANILVKVA